MTGYVGLPMSDADLEKHYEASKRDIVDLVGSEVRQIIGELRHYRASPAQAGNRTSHIDRERLWATLSALHHSDNDPQLIAETMETVISLLCTQGEYVRGWNNACEALGEAMDSKGWNAASVMAEEMQITHASMSWIGDFVTEAAQAVAPPGWRSDDLREAVSTILARCEALEDEASDALATVTANGRDETHEAGFWRGQKSTAKSFRNHLHDLTRAALTTPDGQRGEG